MFASQSRSASSRSVRRLIEAIPEEDWTPIPYWLPGGVAVAETTYTPFQHTGDATAVGLIVRRVTPTPGSQLAPFVNYSYQAFITDRAGEMMELEADHRRHAEIENANPRPDMDALCQAPNPGLRGSGSAPAAPVRR